MIQGFDHVTLGVIDPGPAMTFFGVLGFEVTKDVELEGEPYASHMSLATFKARHIALRLPEGDFEIELLVFHDPQPDADPNGGRLDRRGVNHFCLTVDDIEAAVARVREAGIEVRTPILSYHHRKLVQLQGPEGVVIELAERVG